MRRLRVTLATALALGLWSPAAADFCGDRESQTIFFCKIKNSSRQVTVCRHEDDSFHYAYGRAGEPPELELRHRKDQVVYTPWNGIGSSFWGALKFQNGEFGYEVAYSVPKSEPENIWGGLEVSRNGEAINQKDCRPDSVITRLDELETLF
jgi:hypothetical protein